MGIAIADNFNINMKKPLDGRNQFATLALMKAVTDASIYEGCEAYCVETDKYYKFLSSNTVDASTGKWRERASGGGESYTAGGGIDILNGVISTHNLQEGDMDDIIPNLPAPKVGASNLNDLSDIDLSNPTDGQVLKYNATTGKWENGAGGGTTINSLGDIADVNLSSLADGQMIKWDSASGKWVNANIPETDTSKCYKTDDSAFTDLADADYVPVYDSSATTKKKSLWSNIKSVLKTYFDTLYDLNKNDIPMYGTSSTGASTTAKTASVTRGTFTLTAGAKVCVKFTYTNTAEAPTLNVSSTGAKNIKYIGTDGTVETPNVWWGAGDVVTFIYDGTQFLMQLTYGMPSMPVLGTIGRSDIYDTTEKVVGKWTDGRPLYQKTINFGTLPNSTSKSVVHSISNLGYIADVKATAKNSSGTTIQINHVATDDVGKGVGVSVDSTNVKIITAQDRSSFTTCYVTISYTKTTDSANSYNYANENDYSTSEKIVGTWIDGSYLYQKTIQVTIPTCTIQGEPVNAEYSIGATISKVVSFEGVMNINEAWCPIEKRTASSAEADSTSPHYHNIPQTLVSAYSNSYSTSTYRNKIRIANSVINYSGKTGYVTIKYIKTS